MEYPAVIHLRRRSKVYLKVPLPRNRPLQLLFHAEVYIAIPTGEDNEVDFHLGFDFCFYGEFDFSREGLIWRVYFF